jgi:hypothetical protein
MRWTIAETPTTSHERRRAEYSSRHPVSSFAPMDLLALLGPLAIVAVAAWIGVMT